MYRTELINGYIKKCGYKKYLEIGVEKGMNFQEIEVEYKVGVDPDPSSKATIFKTSDDYFSTLDETFDIIFIDGLHLAEQVVKDIENSLNVLNEGGIIIVHDCLPDKESTQLREIQNGDWTGDVWKGWVELRTKRSDICMKVLDIDWGLGIIEKGKQKLIKINKELNWNNFCENKKGWMNIISL